MAGKRMIPVMVLVLVLGTGSVASAATIDRPIETKLDPSFGSAKVATLTTVTAGRALAYRARPNATVTPTSCGDGSPFLCGSVAVPIDRADPGGRTIDIGFQILPADPAVARPDPIFVAEGGPGGSTTGDRDFWAFYALASLTDNRDLVLIDQRGTGLSGAIDCPDLQNGWNSVEELRTGIRRCGRSLGGDADRYGTGDIALDIEAVRRALGYDRINYFGGSYGSVVEQAYASRFPDHLRSMVIDAGLPVDESPPGFGWGLDVPGAYVRAVVLACQRAPSCAAQHPDPASLFAALARRLDQHPVTGWGRDAFGNRRHVTIDQVVLAWIVGSNPLNQGEVAAATVALLAHHDEKPLLRLGAESYFWPGDAGDPRFFSAGANWATWCNDVNLGFDRSAPAAVRQQQFEASWGTLPDDTFAPFTIDAWRGFWWPDVCTQWPSPDRFVPALRPGPKIDIPVLVLEGDLDFVVPMESSDSMAAHFADPVIVRLHGGGHINVGWSPGCAQVLTDHFFRTRSAGDTSCADEPMPVFQAVDRFPQAAHGALEATPRAGDESTARDRRAAWSTVKTVLDAWLRSFRTPAAIADGAGLRGGWFHYDFSGQTGALMTIHRCRFVRDVAVVGRSFFSFDFANPQLRAHVRIHGEGTADGELSITSAYWFDTRFGPFRIDGQIGGRHVALTMPGN